MDDLSTITGRIIPGLLVNHLKALIKLVNENIRPVPPLKLGGNKSELIERLIIFITKVYNQHDHAAIQQFRHCIRAAGPPDQSNIATTSYPSTSSTAYIQRPQPTSLSTKPIAIGMLNSKGNAIGSSSGYQQQHLSSNHARPQQSGHPTGASAPFKSSPFYKDIQMLGVPRVCVEAKDRTMSVTIGVTLSVQILNQMKADSALQLMMFCGADEPSANGPTLMEFPHVCEIKVNSKTLDANLRGMKNKPGTVSPANITGLCRLEPGIHQRVEFVYANSTKRYNVALHLVKTISVNSIVREIEHGKFLTKEKMHQLIDERNRDADVMATSSTLSLKCPLGFKRISTPCRSSHCHHLQCFDGYTFFHLNEQTPTWTCPVCSRIMNSWEEIVVDGYFKDILESTPSSLENVIVQADGTWEVPKSAVATPTPKTQVAKKGNVYVIDDLDSSDDNESDEDDTPEPVAPSKPEIEIIDLISDSEDEAEPEPAPKDRSTEAMAVDQDGDAIMQSAADMLQKMSSGVATPAVTTSVKAEMMENSPAAGGTGTSESGSTGSANGATSAQPSSSSGSPVLPIRMEYPEPSIRTESPSRHVVSRSQSSSSTTWANPGEELFMNSLLGPSRRKRLHEDTQEEDPNQETRQRIARLDIRSVGSSEAGSAAPSPDIIARSTSSPTPHPASYMDARTRGQSGHFSEGDDRRSGERPHSSNAYYDGTRK